MDFSSWGAFWASVEAILDGRFGTPISIVAIILGFIIVRVVLTFVIRRVVHRVVSGVKKSQGIEDTQLLPASPVAAARVVQRTRALGGILTGIITAVIVIVALVLIISAIDPNATGAFALITAALGAGLGFGAQNLVRDILSGIFLVAEDQLGVGDVVDLS